jgi:hypothetical protein
VGSRSQALTISSHIETVVGLNVDENFARMSWCLVRIGTASFKRLAKIVSAKARLAQTGKEENVLHTEVDDFPEIPPAPVIV